MILYSSWLSLSLATRHKIASEFGIVKKGPTHVADNIVKDDGYSVKDIEVALTMYNIQKYFGTTETDVTVLWSYLIDKMEGKDIQLLDINTPMQIVEKKEGIIKEVKPRGRPKKYEEKTTSNKE